MIGFIVAVVAGYCTPYAETPLARPVAAVAGRFLKLEGSEMRLLSFMLCLLLAGVASALLQSGSAFWIILGGVLGYFGTRLVASAREAMDKRNS